MDSDAIFAQYGVSIHPHIFLVFYLYDDKL